jgi:hypothetical protein
MALMIATIRFVNVTVYPPTWTFALLGDGFEPGAEVLWTLPDATTVTFHDADIISVTNEVVRVLTTQPYVEQPGTYSVAVRNPSDETSEALIFQMGLPGVIMGPHVGYLHFYGYAFVRPPTPNLTNEPLRLAPGATVTIYEMGTNTLVLLYSSQAGVPTANPVIADVDAFFSVYVAPIQVDVQFSGGGIITPYTIGDAIPLDPRIPALEAAVAVLEGLT